MGICEQPCNFISPVSLMAVSFEESSPLRLNVHKTEAKTNQLLAKKPPGLKVKTALSVLMRSRPHQCSRQP